MAVVLSLRRVLVSSDWHVPFHSRPSVAAMLAFAKDFKPHTSVIAGDFTDMPETSRHNAGSVAQLEGRRIVNTFDAGNEVLDAHDKAVGNAERVFLFGNHDVRLERWMYRADNSVFLDDPALDLARRLNLSQRKYHVIKDYPRGRYKVGHLSIVHGFYCSKHAAAQHVEKYGANVMFGHTHRAGLYLAPTVDGQRGGYALGHMADAEAKELQYGGPITGWSQGFGTVLVRKSGNFQADLVNFVDGVFYWGGKQYGRLLERAA